MTTIQNITTQPYNLPLKSALSWGKGHQLAALDHVLVRVTLSDGATGVAEATPRPTIYGETAESIRAIIERELQPRLAGQPADTLADLDQADARLALLKNNNTAKGALNMALWSAFARSQGKSLAQLLGADREQVRLSFILGTGRLDDVLEEVQTIYEQGVRVLKVKVGKDPVGELELVQHIRQLYGEHIDLYVDANECLTLEGGLDFLIQLCDMGALYCEEALPVRQLESRRAFRQRSPLLIIGDDSCFTLADVERELAFDTFDIVNIKTARTGFSHSNAILRQAQASGKGVMVGSQASSLLGCLHAILYAAQGAIEHPTEGSFFLKVQEEQADKLPITDGYVRVTDAEAVLHVLESQF
ncbi:MAG: enolase [Anaerolineae bacterium]|nr:enolase [Anaerolineae bacterium]